MNRSGWKIYHLQPQDTEKAVPVQAVSFSKEASDYLSPEGFKALAGSPGATLLGAQSAASEDIGPEGYILLRRIGTEAELLSLAAAPQSRNKGLGKPLVQRMLARLREAGARTVFLEVECENQPAISLYESVGFARCGTRKGYYRSQNDALVMKIDIC